jgi:hypothetical protein
MHELQARQDWLPAPQLQFPFKPLRAGSDDTPTGGVGGKEGGGGGGGGVRVADGVGGGERVAMSALELSAIATGSTKMFAMLQAPLNPKPQILDPGPWTRIPGP